jgi:hypothetical protein
MQCISCADVLNELSAAPFVDESDINVPSMYNVDLLAFGVLMITVLCLFQCHLF